MCMMIDSLQTIFIYFILYNSHHRSVGWGQQYYCLPFQIDTTALGGEVT